MSGRRFHLLGAAAIGATLIVAGVAALYAATSYVDTLKAEQKIASQQRTQSEEKLARIRIEGEEIDARVTKYELLVARGVIGDERRLDWIETLERLRSSDPSRQIRYAIAPQKALDYAVAGTAEVSARTSQVKLDATVLHEERFLGLLSELRAALPAHMLVRSCTLDRPATTLATRAGLNVSCLLDLITITDQGKGKTS